MGVDVKDNWSSGSAYEQYVGRWSRRIAAEFIDWLGVAPGLRWADVGCGTGALSGCILAKSQPATVCAVDSSAPYLDEAQRSLEDARVLFEAGDACALPWASGSFDATVSGLVLNFVPDSERMASEMVRVTRPGGTVALYVWDYAGGMQMMRHFWDAALEQNPENAAVDEASRFPLCRPEPLKQLLQRASLRRSRFVPSSCLPCSVISMTTGSPSWAGRGRRPRIWRLFPARLRKRFATP